MNSSKEQADWSRWSTPRPCFALLGLEDLEDLTSGGASEQALLLPLLRQKMLLLLLLLCYCYSATSTLLLPQWTTCSSYWLVRWYSSIRQGKFTFVRSPTDQPNSY